MKKSLSVLIVPAAVALGSLSTSTVRADDAEGKVNIDQLPAPARTTIETRAQGGRIEEVVKLSDDSRLFKAEIKKGDAKDYLYVDATGRVVGEHLKK